MTAIEYVATHRRRDPTDFLQPAMIATSIQNSEFGTLTISQI